MNGSASVAVGLVLGRLAKAIVVESPRLREAVQAPPPLAPASAASAPASDATWAELVRTAMEVYERGHRMWAARAARSAAAVLAPLWQLERWQRPADVEATWPGMWRALGGVRVRAGA